MSNQTLSARTTWPLAVVATLGALNTFAAGAGALGLASGLLGLGDRVESRLPWSSTAVAGLALGLLVAVPNGVLTVLALRRARRTRLAAQLVGAGMVVWIGVELAFIRELSFFHPLYVAVGLVMMAAGATMRREPGKDAREAGPTARRHRDVRT